MRSFTAAVAATLLLAGAARAEDKQPAADLEKSLYAVGLSVAKSLEPFNLTEAELATVLCVQVPVGGSTCSGVMLVTPCTDSTPPLGVPAVPVPTTVALSADAVACDTCTGVMLAMPWTVSTFAAAVPAVPT